MLIRHRIVRNVEAESLEMLIKIQRQGDIEEVVIPSKTFHRDSSTEILGFLNDSRHGMSTSLLVWINHKHKISFSMPEIPHSSKRGEILYCLLPQRTHSWQAAFNYEKSLFTPSMPKWKLMDKNSLARTRSLYVRPGPTQFWDFHSAHITGTEQLL